MKSFIVAVVGLSVAVVSGVAAGQEGTTKEVTKEAAAAPADAKDLTSKACYYIGLNLGRSLKAASAYVDVDMLVKGLKDALSGAKPAFTDAQLLAAMKDFQQQVQARQVETARGASDKNKKEGDAFLAANKAKPGVVTLPSGLQYKVIKEGTGQMPKATDTVTTNYRGTLLDGTEFDSSYKRNEPTSFPVNGVIAGWTEALQKMKVGSKWQLFVPSDLAYGAGRRGPLIGPNSVLIFDIELLSIGAAR